MYLHPAAEETTYTGSVEIGFLSGDPLRPTKLDINQKVPTHRKSNVPIQASVSNRVLAKPGDYRVTMRVIAVTTSGKTTIIDDAVTVTVRASAAPASGVGQ